MSGWISENNSNGTSNSSTAIAATVNNKGEMKALSPKESSEQLNCKPAAAKQKQNQQEDSKLLSTKNENDVPDNNNNDDHQQSLVTTTTATTCTFYDKSSLLTDPRRASTLHRVNTHNFHELISV